MPQFEISNLVLDIDSDNTLLIDPLNEFLLSQYRSPDLTITLRYSDHINHPPGDIIFNQNRITWVRKPVQENGFIVYAGGYENILTLADVNWEWINARIIYTHNKNEIGSIYNANAESLIHILLGVVFRYCILRHEGIVIHSSSIEWNGKGIIFSAPSGTGKSTHVKLWQQYKGESITVLNDDTPAVRFINGKPYIFGTPWSGTSNIHCNQKAPLNAIVVLEQAPENSIQQLTIAEAIQRLMPRVFLPYYDSTMMSIGFNIFEKIISSTPVYLLKCRPDKEAVELVYQWVK